MTIFEIGNLEAFFVDLFSNLKILTVQRSMKNALILRNFKSLLNAYAIDKTNSFKNEECNPK